MRWNFENFQIQNFQKKLTIKYFSAERKDKKESSDNDDVTERKRRQAGQTGGAKSGKNGKKFRPGRVEKKPLRYYQYLAAQIQRKKWVKTSRCYFQKIGHQQRKLVANDQRPDWSILPSCKHWLPGPL